MSDEIPEPRVETARQSLFERFSIVWIVPIGALLISLGIAWQSYSDRGPTIEIAFDNASGIEAGETELRYRDVTIGLVEDVRFAPDLDTVIVEARVENDVAPYIDEGAQFWVVRPQVTAQGVSGLDTVLSGAFIEGSWDATPEGLERRFVGLRLPPIARSDREGLSFVLRSTTGDSLVDGMPILYRGVRVGRVANLRLAEDGVAVLADAFVEEPHDELVTTTTRFWDTSGFAFTLGPQGATLDVTSLASLVTGGVSFATLVEGGVPVESGAVFELFPDRDAAQESVFAEPGAEEQVRLSVVLTGDTRGLTAGSPVEFRGIRVGEVAEITGHVDEERFGDRRVRLLATIELRPARLGMPGEPAEAEVYAFLSDLVDRGLRAQLARGGLLAGGLKVDLAVLADPPPAELDLDAEPYPVLPSVAVDLPDATATAEGLIQRIAALPIESLLDSAVDLLDSLDAVVGSDAVRQAPEEVVAILADLRQLVGSDAVQALPEQTAGIAEALEAAAGDLQTVLQQVEAAGTVATLTETLASASQAADALTGVVEGVQPATDDVVLAAERLAALSEDAAALVAKAEALPIEDLVTEATAAVSAVRALVDNPQVQEVPVAVASTLAELEAALAELRQSALVETAVDALASAEQAAEAVTGIADSVPPLVAQIEELAATATALVGTAEALPLSDLVGEAQALVASAQSLVGSPAVQRVPAELADALAGLDAALADVQETELIGTAAGALTSAGQAADAVTAATAGVPELIAEIESVATAVDEVAQTAQALPLDALAAEATEAAAALGGLLAAPETQAIPADVSQALAGLDAAIADIREANLAEQASDTLAAADRAASAVAVATEDLPEIVAELQSLVATANALPLRPAVENAAELIATLEALVGSETVAGLPARVAATVAELSATVEELRASGVIATANETLTSAGRAAEAVSEATEGVPLLVEDLAQLAQTANALPLEQLLSEATSAVEAARGILAAEGVEQLPATLNATLAEVEATLAELREGDLVETTTQTVESAGRAAEALAEATGELPQLVQQLEALALQAEGTLVQYGEEGALSREAQTALREVRNAARSVSSLARTIERNPNSIFLGR